MTNNFLLESFNLPIDNQQHIDALRHILENDVDTNIMFEGIKALEKIHNKYNELILELGIDESCLVKPGDSASTIRKKCKKAFGHGLKMEPMRQIYAVDDSPIAARLSAATGGAMGEAQLSYSYGVSAFDGHYKKRTPPEEKYTLSKKWAQADPDSALSDEEELDEEKSSTERVRKYYKRHPEKVKSYLRKTVDDRVKRNKDRREAVKKHGKSKMKNHDVHHPNGVNGSWELAKKDHGRDKKDDKKKTPSQKTTPKKQTPQKQPVKKTTPKKPTIDPMIQKFLDFAVKKIGIQNPPKLIIVEPSDEMTALGAFDPQTNRIMLVTKGRLMADILRTLAHELIHVKQNELGKITDPIRDGEDGSPIENQANAAAGVLMRQFGRDNKKIYLSENLLLEGGAAGHMSHPFEDKDLTFGDMKTMIDRALIGSLDVEEPATEKLDGQNIAFTVRDDGQIVFARNKGHVKNRGENALDVAGIRQMFAGRGAIEKAFGGAAEDLAAAVEKLTPEQRQELFKGGSNFMNIEVILPDSQNVIPYGRSVLVMHGTIEYDDAGTEVNRDNDAGRSFAKAVRQVGADRQKTFGIEGPRTIAFDESVDEELETKADEYKAAIDRAAARFDLGDDARLEDYRRAWWENEIEETDKNQNLGLSPKQKEQLVSRWADGDKKAIGVKDLETPEQKEWFRTFESDELQNAQKKMIRPIEYAFLKTGTQALKRVTGWMSANNPEAANQIRKDTIEAIKGIRDSDDPDLIAKMQQQFDKLEAMGLDNVVPSEGIVFTYNGNLYKFTGTFAPINQITGTFKFGMPPKTEEKPEEPKKEPVKEPRAEKPEEPTEQPPEEPMEEPETPGRTVAIFAGRFHPFHKGHYSVYQNLVDRFGKENVYIASSNVQKDPAKQPFNFNQKKEIITQMFDVPEDMVVQVKNPYAPSEILDKLPDNTTYVTAVSQKDAERLAGSKYFKNIEDAPEGERVGYKQGGYFAVTPEFQLDINGKNISGTALRHVMGSPKYTDRAKEEIFTKVYGRFDQDIFDMVTKVTGKAEEELEKTKQYTDKKPTTPEVPSGERKTKKPDQEAMGRAKSVLTQKVFNPDTQRDILVATALKYKKGHPARQEAERMIQQAMRQQNEVLTEVTKAKPKKLKLYMYTRDYSNKELENEIGEYFENEETLKLFPKLAKDKKELRQLILDAPTVTLSRKELSTLANSEVPEILSGKNVAKTLKKLETKYEKDVRGVLKAVKNEAEMALPIVISHPKGLYLMGGNTRLSVLASIGHTMPVKVLDYSEQPAMDPNTGALPGPVGKELTRQQYRKKFDDIMKMMITNPETGNQIKIDTAMDYKKTHPAHQLALGIIRQQLGSISPTAGIPKNRRYS